MSPNFLFVKVTCLGYNKYSDTIIAAYFYVGNKTNRPGVPGEQLRDIADSVRDGVRESVCELQGIH